jgi:hypothetical protein
MAYEKKVAPNKHLVQGVVYHRAKEFFGRNVEALILLGRQPKKAIERAVEYITGAGKKLFCYDMDSIAVKRAKNIRMNAGHKNMVVRMGNIAEAPCTHFQDIDFCGPFITNRKNLEAQFEIGANAWVLDPNDPLCIVTDRINEMRKLKGRKVMTCTVMAARASYGKGFTFLGIKSIIKQLGYTLVDIDGVVNGYGRGTKISIDGARHGNGGVYHTYYHKAHLRKTRAKHAVSICDVDVYTYTDTVPMLVLSIMFE